MSTTVKIPPTTTLGVYNDTSGISDTTAAKIKNSIKRTKSIFFIVLKFNLLIIILLIDTTTFLISNQDKKILELEGSRIFSITLKQRVQKILPPSMPQTQKAC